MAYLTESGKRATWLAAGETELRVGGRVEFRFDHASLDCPTDALPPKYAGMGEAELNSGGRVTQCDPLRRLAFAWIEGDGESEVTFELTPDNGGTRLRLTHARLGDDPDKIAGAGAGWITHVGILSDILADRPRRPFWATHGLVEDAVRARLEAG